MKGIWGEKCCLWVFPPKKVESKHGLTKEHNLEPPQNCEMTQECLPFTCPPFTSTSRASSRVASLRRCVLYIQGAEKVYLNAIKLCARFAPSPFQNILIYLFLSGKRGPVSTVNVLNALGTHPVFHDSTLSFVIS